MSVSFSCAVAGIVVHMKENVCQIVAKKNKKEIVGAQLVPLCKIVLPVLKPFRSEVLSFIQSHAIHYRMFPLDSHQEVLSSTKMDGEKYEKLEGTQLVAHFRKITYDTTHQIEKWEVSAVWSVAITILKNSGRYCFGFHCRIQLQFALYLGCY